MENRKISIKTIIILIMVVIIIALVMMNLNNKNNNIEQQLTQKEQLEEITEDSAYVDMQKHMSEVQEKEQKLVSFKSAIASAITEKGVETASNADETTMVNNIKSIPFESTYNTVIKEHPGQVLSFSIDKKYLNNPIVLYYQTGIGTDGFTSVTSGIEVLKHISQTYEISGRPILLDVVLGIITDTTISINAKQTWIFNSSCYMIFADN